MATSPARKTTAPPPRRTSTTSAPAATNTTSVADSAAVVEGTEGDKINLTAASTAKDEIVTAIVPRGFTLTLDDHTPVQYGAGTQEMPASHAGHWYSRAVGVKIYTPKA